MENQFHPAMESPVVLALKFLIGLMAVFYISSLLLRSEESLVKSEEAITNDAPTTTTTETVLLKDDGNAEVTAKPVDMQPHCPISDVKVILKEILLDLYVKKEMCTPEDVNNAEKHKLPKVASRTNKIAEPKGTMVVYLAVGLLLTSLGAAFIEVFKAKQQPQTKSKPPLTRTCSLADLTVLRHNRKESMRRDSFVDFADHRGPSKLLGPGDFTYGGYGPSAYGFHGSRSVSRKASIDNEGTFPTEHRHTHFRLLHRH